MRNATDIYNLQLEAIERLKQLALEGEVSFELPEDFDRVFLSGVYQILLDYI